MTQTVPERLRKAAALFEERNAAYGGNYLEFGRVMAALFPEGLGPQPMSEGEYRRLMLVCHMVTKLTRYCNSLRRGGHADSLEDLAVYAMMTAETDEMEPEWRSAEEPVAASVMENLGLENAFSASGDTAPVGEIEKPISVKLANSGYAHEEKSNGWLRD